ncbi:MAG TPA: DoxX family protein, partial [Steroidobacteraceae bacterium]
MSVRTSGSATPHGLPASSPAGSGIDGFAQSSRDWLLLLGRILLGGIFVLSGCGKLMGLSAFAASLEQKGVPFASVMALIGAPVEFFGGLAIVLGIE